jgi:uncharacterized alkaline shock family protein YloU
VIAKIARHAAQEVDGVECHPGTGWRPGGRGNTEVRVDGTSATVELAIGLRYPLPVWETAVRAQQQVARRLKELAGIDHLKVELAVSELLNPLDPNRRRLR